MDPAEHDENVLAKTLPTSPGANQANLMHKHLSMGLRQQKSEFEKSPTNGIRTYRQSTGRGEGFRGGCGSSTIVIGRGGESLDGNGAKGDG